MNTHTYTFFPFLSQLTLKIVNTVRDLEKIIPGNIIIGNLVQN